MKLTGAAALMEIFRREGVEYIFGIPGATEVFFMDALEDQPDIRYILGLHEVVAAGMAEGYARTSGKAGVLNLHTGPGLAAALPMLSNASAGGVPLIVTAGQQDTRIQACEPALAGDLVRIAGPFTKWATEITHAGDIPAIFRRAFKYAKQSPTGPVFISLPQNIMADIFDFEYIEDHSHNTHLYPDPASVETAAGLLASARNPAIIIEDGVTKNEAQKQVVEFAELIGARVYEYWMSDVNCPVNHPLYAGDLDLTSLRTRDLLEKVDVLIVIGAELFRLPVYLEKPLLSPATRIIQIDDNPWQIGKNFPVFSSIEGNIRFSLSALSSFLRKTLMPATLEGVQARIRAFTEEKQRSDQLFAEKASREWENTPISTSRLMQEIKENLLPGTRIVDDCWSCSAVLRRTLAFSEAKSYQRSRNGGSIGWGLPGALGVKLASPDRPVVCISGDGSAMWSIQSLWTAAHYNIPVTFIICANGCYQQVRNMKTLIMKNGASNRNLGTSLCQPQNNFCTIAEGMGIPAQRVEYPGQVKSALQQAFNLNRPNLVEVILQS
jgi:benzoylformate decarboxylase